MFMGEQEKFKKVLKKMIDETEKNNIRSAEELLRQLVQELSSTQTMRENA